ncbi:MAG: hypothetical protein F4118_00525 [Acidimicrobiaceae bacterium]|nr:hypothetical protein [Candidatus Poribacteria bacterium]MYI34906.1 hypothetical protein [Acidimicrobiaceae bacterium]
MRKQLPESMQVRFRFDLGRGIEEEFTYWPAEKTLAIEWKQDDGTSKVLKITEASTGQVEQELWKLCEPQRLYHDAFETDGPEPEDIPVGALGDVIILPDGYEVSIVEPQSPIVHQSGEPPHEQVPFEAKGQEEPELNPTPQENPTPQPGTNQQFMHNDMPVVVVDQQTYIDHQVLIENSSLIIDALAHILETTLPKDSTERGLVKMYLDKHDQLRGKYYGEGSYGDVGQGV